MVDDIIIIGNIIFDLDIILINIIIIPIAIHMR